MFDARSAEQTPHHTSTQPSAGPLIVLALTEDTYEEEGAGPLSLARTTWPTEPPDPATTAYSVSFHTDGTYLFKLLFLFFYNGLYNIVWPTLKHGRPLL